MISNKQTISTPATFSDIFLGIFAICCNVVFAIYFGGTLGYYPIDLIKCYIQSPEKPEATSHVLAKKLLKEKSIQLIEKGRDIYHQRRELSMDNEKSKD